MSRSGLTSRGLAGRGHLGAPVGHRGRGRDVLGVLAEGFLGGHGGFPEGVRRLPEDIRNLPGLQWPVNDVPGLQRPPDIPALPGLHGLTGLRRRRRHRQG